jgi:hypothetical protein
MSAAIGTKLGLIAVGLRFWCGIEAKATLKIVAAYFALCERPQASIRRTALSCRCAVVTRVAGLAASTPGGLSITKGC